PVLKRCETTAGCVGCGHMKKKAKIILFLAAILSGFVVFVLPNAVCRDPPRGSVSLSLTDFVTVRPSSEAPMAVARLVFDGKPFSSGGRLRPPPSARRGRGWIGCSQKWACPRTAGPLDASSSYGWKSGAHRRRVRI